MGSKLRDSLVLPSDPKDYSAEDITKAREITAKAFPNDAEDNQEALTALRSYFGECESSRDFARLDKLLKVLIELSVVQSEIVALLDRWKEVEEVNLQTLAKRFSSLLHNEAASAAIDNPDEAHNESFDDIEENIVKQLCALSFQRSAGNRLVFIRIHPRQHLKDKDRNVAVIAKDDLDTDVGTVLRSLNFTLIHSFVAAREDFGNDLLHNFVVLDMSAPRGESVNLKELDARTEVLARLLLASNSVQYFRVFIESLPGCTNVEHDGTIYYYETISPGKNDHVVSKIKDDLLGPAFEDSNFNIVDRILIGLFMPTDIQTVKYERIKSGFSGSRNYFVTPIYANQSPGNPSVIKIDVKGKLKQEERNYKDIIHPNIAHALSVNKVMLDDADLGGIRYEFATARVGINTHSIKKIYQMSAQEFKSRFRITDGTEQTDFLCGQIDKLFGDILASFNRTKPFLEKEIGREFSEYVDDAAVETNLAKLIPDQTDKATITFYAKEMANPLLFWRKFKSLKKKFPIKNVHGDLHTENIMIDEDRLAFLIDYGKAKNNGHFLIDYCMLEVSLKLDLISRSIPYTALIQFEEFLITRGKLDAELEYATPYDDIRNSCAMIEKVRNQAGKFAASIDPKGNKYEPFNHYLISLFCLSYAQLAYKDMNQQYALISTGLLASELDKTET